MSVSITNNDQFRQRCKSIRSDVLDCLVHVKRGHLASALSTVETVVTLYDAILRVDPRNPQWFERDRFILSKGHGCLALYAVLADKGFFPKSELNKISTPNGLLGGHPEHGKIPGIEASTGSLGHGLSIAVGFALAARLDCREIRCFVLLGDGECNEGSIWEGALSASKHRLTNLVVLIDYNKQQSYGTTSQVLNLEPFADKWRSFGFAVREIDMVNEPEHLKGLLSDLPFEQGKPNAVILHTIKGQGIKSVEGNLAWHHKSSLNEEAILKLKQELLE